MAKTSRSERAKAWVATLTAVFLLACLAQVLIAQDIRARDNQIERFQVRGQTGAQLISAYIADLATREAKFAASELSDAQPSRPAFDAFVRSLGFEAAVLLDGQGRLLQVFPFRPELLGENLAARPEYGHLAGALRGRISVSDVVPSAAQGIPILGIAVPYETPFGRRVVSGAFAIGASPLDEFVRNLLPFAAKVYMVDGDKRIAASTVSVAEPFTPLARHDPDLYSSFRFETANGYTSGGVRHVLSVSEIPNTSWRLVMSAPEAQVLRPLNQLRWVPWLVYAGLAIASTIALVLLVRLWKRERQLRSERHKLVEQLDEESRLNKALDEFAGRVAHDLRGPLGNVLAATQMAAKHKGDDAKFDQWVATVQSQVRRGIDLIQGLLELAKAAGTPRREPVDLDALVAELSREIEGVSVEAHDLPSIEADPLTIRQALANLLENAGRYARTNGTARVAVRAEMEGRSCTITVEDHGPGISVDEVKSVFRPFQRGKANEVPGTGLGLAIVATTAQAHGGRAWYEPRSGGGSSFKISIPKPPHPDSDTGES